MEYIQNRIEAFKLVGYHTPSMNDETDPDDISVINNAEVVETLGNMFLVKVDGEMKQVPATYKNELLYKHELYELLHPSRKSERVVLTDEQDSRFVAVAPTENDSVYQIWIDDNPYPVMNPPSMAENVLRGIRDALDTPSDYERLYEIYQEIRSTRVRRSVMEKASNLFPRSEIIPEEEGWNILGIFLLTWDARVFLNTGNVDDQTAYRVAGSGVSETDDAKEFLQLAVNDQTIEQYRDITLDIRYPLPNNVNLAGSEVVNKECPTCGNGKAYRYYDDVSVEDEPTQERPVYVCTDESCGQAWQEYDLTEREIEFIAKAQWLVNHREKLDDDAFWDVVESYVWHQSG